MKICPKCSFPSESNTECDKCGVQFGDVKNGRGADRIDLFCPWNDHGRTCGKRGSVSETTNGTGPWYCSEHFWKMKGMTDRTQATPMPPDLREKLKTWTALYNRPPRERQPGDDDDIPMT